LIDLISGLDIDILIFIQNSVRTPLLTAIFGFFSIICNKGFIWLFLTAVLLLNKSTRALGIRLLLCVALSWVISDLVLKITVERTRPFDYIDGLSNGLKRFADANSYSFPSGHSTSSFAAAFCICRYAKRKGWLIYFPASMIALSRVYLGVHHPSDIIAGVLIGTTGAFIVCIVTDYLCKRKFKRQNHGLEE